MTFLYQILSFGSTALSRAFSPSFAFSLRLFSFFSHPVLPPAGMEDHGNTSSVMVVEVVLWCGRDRAQEPLRENGAEVRHRREERDGRHAADEWSAVVHHPRPERRPDAVRAWNKKEERAVTDVRDEGTCGHAMTYISAFVHPSIRRSGSQVPVE